MKKLIVIISIIITLYSCSKDSPVNQIINESANGSIQYKVNGNLVVMDNVDLLSGQYVIFYKQLKGSILTDTRYILNAQKGANNVLILAMISDSLQVKNYHYDSAAVFDNSLVAVALNVNYNGQIGSIIFNGDYVDINISSYKGSRISGTFTGKVTTTSVTPGDMVITEGKLNNVQVIY